MSIFYIYFLIILLFIGYIFIYKRHRTNKKDIIILICTIVLITYYFPSDNILKRYDINSIRVCVDNGYKNNKDNIEVNIVNQKDVQEILHIINKFKFYKSIYRTISDVSLPNNDMAISLYMHDQKESKFIYLYITNGSSNFNLLKIDNQSYNAIEDSDLMREMMDKLDKIRTKRFGELIL